MYCMVPDVFAYIKGHKRIHNLIPVTDILKNVISDKDAQALRHLLLQVPYFKNIHFSVQIVQSFQDFLPKINYNYNHFKLG
jgi:cysteinyl-tRNA synthetase